MKAPSSAIVFLVILAISSSLAVLPEDLAETAFDESETMPFESAPGFSLVTPRALIAEVLAKRGVVGVGEGTLFHVPAIRISGRGTNPSRDARRTSALLCNLRC